MATVFYVNRMLIDYYLKAAKRVITFSEMLKVKSRT